MAEETMTDAEVQTCDGPTSRAVTVAAVRHAPMIPFRDLERMAESFARSNLFGAKTEAQALALLMIGQAEDMHPALAMQEFDIIENKPCRKAERVQARFQLSGGKIEWLELTDKVAKAEFSHPQGSKVTIEWTIEQASKIIMRTKEGPKPLTNKDNWKNYPRAMLRARCVAEGARTSFPAYAIVTLATEEAMDYGTLESQVVEDDGANDPITEAQLEALRAGVEASGADIAKFCSYMAVEALPDIKQGDFMRALEALAAKKKKAAPAEAGK